MKLIPLSKQTMKMKIKTMSCDWLLF